MADTRLFDKLILALEEERDQLIGWDRDARYRAGIALEKCLFEMRTARLEYLSAAAECDKVKLQIMRCSNAEG